MIKQQAPIMYLSLRLEHYDYRVEVIFNDEEPTRSKRFRCLGELLLYATSCITEQAYAENEFDYDESVGSDNLSFNDKCDSHDRND